MFDVTSKEYDIISIQVRVMVMLNEVCGLSHERVSEIVNTTDILDVIRDTYTEMHQEGDRANMLGVQEALHYRGVDINVPPITDIRWKKWLDTSV